ncbi:MAG TPA: hypothetical protein VGX70_00165 [Gemmataceae bacterium]|nr:hypothetical protein [Gemmataceae bacterium]
MLEAKGIAGNQIKEREFTKKWNKTWEGKKVRIRGEISKIYSGGTGLNPITGHMVEYVRICMLEVTFFWDYRNEADAVKAKSFDRGQTVTIEGVVTSWRNGVGVNDCYIVNPSIILAPRDSWPPSGAGYLTLSDGKHEIKEGTITNVKTMKSGRMELTIENKDGKGSTVFPVLMNTMIYQLENEKNRETFSKEGRGTAFGGWKTLLSKVTWDAENYRKQLDQIHRHGPSTNGLKNANAAFLRFEEQRRAAYGQPVKLEVGQKVLAVITKSGDDTLGIFVLEPAPAKAEK